eukprot:12856203-Alexandrium_andersonii.AAC.1
MPGRALKQQSPSEAGRVSPGVVGGLQNARHIPGCDESAGVNSPSCLVLGLGASAPKDCLVPGLG